MSPMYMETSLFSWNKIMSTAKKDLLARERVDFRSASALSRGRPMRRFTHLRLLQGLTCEAKFPKTEAGSTPINHSAKCLYFFHRSIAIKWPIICILRGNRLLFSMWRSEAWHHLSIKWVVNTFTLFDFAKKIHFYRVEWEPTWLPLDSETGEPLHGSVTEETIWRSPTGKQVVFNENLFSPFKKYFGWFCFPTQWGCLQCIWRHLFYWEI